MRETKSRPKSFFRPPGRAPLLAAVLSGALVSHCGFLCGPRDDRPRVTIRYIIVINSDLPRVGSDTLSRWLGQAGKMYKEEVDLRFQKLYTLELDEFYARTLDQLQQKRVIQNYGEFELIDDIVSVLKRYRIDELDLITPFSVSDIPFPYDYLSQLIRDHFRKKLSRVLELFGVNQDVYLYPLSTAFFWERVIGNPDEYDMIITNEPILSVRLKYENVDLESPYEIIPVGSLGNPDERQCVVSTIPWSILTYLKDTGPHAYIPGKDYYLAAVISHELAHTFFSVGHLYPEEQNLMDPDFDSRVYLSREAVLGPSLKSKIKAWKHLQNARHYAKRGRYRDSRYELLEAIKIQSDFLPAYEELSGLARKLENLELSNRYERAADNIRAEEEKIQTAYWNMRKHYLHAGRLDRGSAKSIDDVIREYRKVTGVDYHQISRYRHLTRLYGKALNRLCEISLEQERFSEAAECLEHLITIQPEHKESYYRLGWSYFNLKKWKPAGQYLLQYLALDPEGSYSSLAEMYLVEIQDKGQTDPGKTP